MEKNNGAALAFAALVWTVLLLLLADKAYHNFVDEMSRNPIDFNPKSTEDMLNGNP